MNSLLHLDKEALNTGIKNTPLKALVVDDSKLDQLILKKMLMKNGYEVLIVTDGAAAIDMFKTNTPDIVFMDLHLPDASGYEITKRLKLLSVDQYIPIIFVTGETDDAALEGCLDAGGDDFIVKPIKEGLLNEKIHALIRIKMMHDVLQREKNDISKLSLTQEKDINDTKEIIGNIEKPLFYNPGNIKFKMEEQFFISGDMICSAVGPTGDHYMLVGDNTGHGLPAAIGSIIIYNVFYTMVDKGFELEIIVEEINKKLLTLLPVDRFFAATVIQIYSEYKAAKVFNAGMPDVIIMHENGSVKKKVSSMDMPLGIRNIFRKEVETKIVTLNSKSRIYIFSDGLPEMFNVEDKQYSQDRLIKTLKKASAAERFESVLADANKFLGDFKRSDDLLFVEINCNKTLVNIAEKIQDKTAELEPMDWSFRLDLHGKAISNSNPVRTMIESIATLQGLRNHHENLFLILSEMYSNSLEHGLLNLDSSIKEEENGFEKYYGLRESRLETIENESLFITVSNRVENDKKILSISMKDSGSGFDYAEIEDNIISNTNKSGRGMALLAELCSNYEYSEEGRALKVQYEW